MFGASLSSYILRFVCSKKNIVLCRCSSIGHSFLFYFYYPFLIFEKATLLLTSPTRYPTAQERDYVNFISRAGEHGQGNDRATRSLALDARAVIR